MFILFPSKRLLLIYNIVSYLMWIPAFAGMTKLGSLLLTLLCQKNGQKAMKLDRMGNCISD